MMNTMLGLDAGGAAHVVELNNHEPMTMHASAMGFILVRASNSGSAEGSCLCSLSDRQGDSSTRDTLPIAKS